MSIFFTKYQSLGNDFILIENKSQDFFFTPEQIQKICSRKFGIGADGLILFTKEASFVSMKFFNSDGSIASMCGNGLRCLFYETDATRVHTDAGEYFGSKNGSFITYYAPIPKKLGTYELFLQNKKHQIELIDSGVEHAVVSYTEVEEKQLISLAREIRFHPLLGEKGANVNFIYQDEPMSIKTYERGVEDFTLACGTGALACFFFSQAKEKRIYFSPDRFCDLQKEEEHIKMTAEVKKVFQGSFVLANLL